MQLLSTLFGVASAQFMLCTALSALPDLTPVSLQIPPDITNVPNPLVQVVWAVTNQGVGEASGSWADGVYISTNQSLDNTALFVTSIWFGASPLEPGDIYWTTNTLSLPVVSNGNYFVILNVDAFNFVPES